MTWAPSETQKVIFEILSTDVALTALLGANKIFDRVPQEQPFPFVTIGDLQGTDRGNHTWEGWAFELTINVWYREQNAGRKGVQAIQKRIDELLHKQDPCIDGWNIVKLRRSTVNVVIDPDQITIHGIQKFNIMLGEA